MMTKPFVIRVRRWAEIVEENRQRLHFFRERLDFSSDEREAVDQTLQRLTRDTSEPATTKAV